MTLRLVDTAWGKELTGALQADTSSLNIICPFIKARALDRLLALRPQSIRVITRFNLADFADGVSDINALRRLLAAGGQIRGIKNLHAKLYLFGSSSAIVTSANLTSAALDRNQEFGAVVQDTANIAICRTYFERLWNQGRNDLLLDQLDAWDEVVARHRATGIRPVAAAELGDFGAIAIGIAPPPTVTPVIVAEASQAFVKFLGESNNRAPLTCLTVDELRLSGCHRVVAYPASKRPRGVRDDALMFIGRMTEEPNDIRVFGRAIGMKYVPGRDDATPEDIALRRWREEWSRYIRVHHAEFVAGDMANGVSLNELMDTLGADAFAATQRNKAKGRGNTNPRRAYLQQAAVELSAEGLAWLRDRVQSAFDEHGTVPQDLLDLLDEPASP